MLTTNPKSGLQKKLLDAQLVIGHILALTALRSEMHIAKMNGDDEQLEWYGEAYFGGAIDGAIAALAARADSEIDDVHSALSKLVEPEVDHA
jgi:hypothetical protein